MSETIRVTKQTKEALLRVAARLQGQKGKRIDFDEAINHLIEQEGRNAPESFMKFVGSAKKKGVNSTLLVGDLIKERRLDELRAKRKFRA